MPDVGTEIAEGDLGCSVPEIVGPSPQHQVQPAQQVSKGSVPTATAQCLHLAFDGRQSGFGRVGVDEPQVRIGLPQSTVRRRLQELQAHGIVKRMPGTGPETWSLPDETWSLPDEVVESMGEATGVLGGNAIAT